MATNSYPCEARSIDAFLAQVVRYVSSGHYFYVRCLVPDSKDARAVDQKILGLYDIRRKRWQRKRRHLKASAGIHYLRYRRLFVIMLTKGEHQSFYRDHAAAVLDIRRTALKAFGYSVRYGFSEQDKRRRVFVRLDKETYRTVKSHMLSVATWPSYRHRDRMEREFRRLPYQLYEPVRRQLYTVARAVNDQRRCVGFPPVDYSCIASKMRVTRVFHTESRHEQQLGGVRSSESRQSP